MNENTNSEYKTFCEIKVNQDKPSVESVLKLGQSIINELLKENAELKAQLKSGCSKNQSDLCTGLNYIQRLEKENDKQKTDIENLKKDMEKILLENSDLKTILKGIHTNVGIALKDYNVQ